MKYRPEIDGLRAIAVLPVILFHAGFQTFSGGFTGVDVFFVISGFLITTIIYTELNQDNFSIVKFYERRARRILPLLFLVLLFTIPLAWISLFQMDMIDYLESLVAVPLFSSNLLFAAEADYFDTSVDLKPLLHTWSLAVEEQYYILFPLFMILVWKFNQKKRLLTLLYVFGILSFIFMEWASFTYPNYNFYILPSRSWELAIGAILAIAIKKSLLSKIQNNLVASEVLSGLGLFLILLGVFVIKSDTRFPSSFALLPTVGTVLVIGFSNQNNFIGRLLSMRILVFIGLISYSAYLWHHPIFAFYKHLSLFEDTFLSKIILSLAIIPISYLSWKYVENPFRNKKRFSKKFIFTFSIIGSLVFILFGFIGIKNEGFPNRLVNTKLNILNYTADNRKLAKDSWVQVRSAKKKFDNKSWYNKSSNLPNLLLIGNSHSNDLYNSFLSSTQARDQFDLARIGGEVRDLSQRENNLYKSTNYQEADIVVIVSHYYKVDLPYIEPLVKNILQDNKMVVLVKEVYKFTTINSRTLADISIQDYLRNGNNIDSLHILSLVDEINNAYYLDYLKGSDLVKNQSDIAIDQIKLKYPEVIVLDRNDYICSEEKQTCFAIDTKLQKFFHDARHNTSEGAVFFGKRIDETEWLSPVIQSYK